MGRESIDGVFPCDGSEGLADQACWVQELVECCHGYGYGGDEVMSNGNIDCLMMCGAAGQMSSCSLLLHRCSP